MIRFDLCKLPQATRIYCDYVGRKQQAVSLFERDPFELDSYRSIADMLESRDYNRERVSALLLEMNSGWSADEAALVNCRRLALGDCVAVLTGQQVGLLGGPMLTALKALHAVRLAGELEERLARPVVPIFWLELEDHDLDEVSRLTVKNARHKLVELHLEAKHGAGKRAPVRDIVLGAEYDKLRRELAGLWPRTENSRAAWKILDGCYSAEDTFATGFAAFFARLMSRFGLVLADPSHEEFKRIAAPVFSAEISGPLTDLEAFTQQQDRLDGAGYHTQVETTPGNMQLFVYEGGEKHRLAVEGDECSLVGSDTRLSRGELKSLAEEKPEAFAPSVLLRPLVQDTLFPTAAYVAGPAEVAYFAQIRPLYEAMGIPMPAIMPRAGATLIGAAARRTLRDFDIDLAEGELFQEREELIKNVVAKHVPDATERLFTQARSGVAEAMSSLLGGLEASDEGFIKAAQSTARKIDYHMGKLERKYIKALERKNEAAVRRLERLANTLYPGGTLQERVFTVAQFTNLYGEAVFDTIAEAFEPLKPDHVFIEV